MKRKKVILAVLFIVFAASLVYRFTHPYRQPRVSRLTHSGSRKRVVVKKNRAKGDDAILKSPEVLMGILAASPRHHGEVIHDPFSRPDGRVAKTAEPPVKQPAAAGKETRPAAEDPRARAQRELNSFRVFGSCQEKGTSMLFLERGKDIFIVRPGDKIDGKYLVKSINGSSLELWAEEIQENIHIDLSAF